MPPPASPSPDSPPSTHVAVPRLIWCDGAFSPGARTIPEETPIALTYGRSTHAVMMATPDDLADFAYGFSLCEGIIRQPSDIARLEIVAVPDGVELRMDLVAQRQDGLSRRQRRITGPGGCGLCGMDSLAEALRPATPVLSDARFTPEQIHAARGQLAGAQRLNALTRAVHAAAFWTPAEGLIAAREDAGRHNALDKLIGAIARMGHDASTGILLLSSRVSVEMVQKAAVLGTPVIVAVSAPTALAVRVAEAANLTLIGVARDDAFEVFTHPARIVAANPGVVSHVA